MVCSLHMTMTLYRRFLSVASAYAKSLSPLQRWKPRSAEGEVGERTRSARDEDHRRRRLLVNRERHQIHQNHLVGDWGELDAVSACALASHPMWSGLQLDCHAARLHLCQPPASHQVRIEQDAPSLPPLCGVSMMETPDVCSSDRVLLLIADCSKFVSMYALMLET